MKTVRQSLAESMGGLKEDYTETFNPKTSELIIDIWGHAIGGFQETRDIIAKLNNPDLQKNYTKLCKIFNVQGEIESPDVFKEVTRKAESYLKMLEEKELIIRGDEQEKVLEKIEMLLSLNTSETNKLGMTCLF